jgi:F-type H+-transporting ATPase subunit delta
MKQVAVAHKYARALFEAAQEAGTFDRVVLDMSGLGALHATDPAFHKFMVSPKMLTEHKVEFVRAVFGPRLDPMTVHFLELLIDKNRINILSEIVESFDELVEEHRGLVRAKVVTAVALNPEQERRLKSGLDTLTGKNVVIEKRIDPRVLGGVVVHLKSHILDGSLQNGLKLLGERLHRAEVN